MTPEQSEALIALSERMLLRDLASLATVRAEQARLRSMAAAEDARVEAERSALPPDAGLTARRVLDQFTTAAAARRDSLNAQAEALADREIAARRTAHQAFGRRRGIELLAERAKQARAEKAKRAEERLLSAVAAVKAVARRPSDEAPPP